ncbi:MAG: hypothetical protein GY835_13360 [bacterium]|nr:hypothetical protein [bacterium]
MRALPDGSMGPNLLIGPGELFEALNPVIDFRTIEQNRLIERLGSLQIAARTKEHKREIEK